jgi:Chaperone of endosialidase
LVYTPITPCRVFDTRTPGAAFVSNGLTSGELRTIDIDGTDLSAQGGSAAGCNVPADTRAVVLAFSPIDPSTTGWMVGAANDSAPLPASTLFNYSAGVALTTFTVIMPMKGQTGGDIRLEARGVAAYSMHAVGDVTGYFMPPNRAGDGLRVTFAVSGFYTNAPNTTNGSAGNTIVGERSTIAGGGVVGTNCYGLTIGQTRSCINSIDASLATIGGGAANLVSGWGSTVSGGIGNTAEGPGTSISGGSFNVAQNTDSAVAGGKSNIASGQESAVLGGFGNAASGTRASIVGGLSNVASGAASGVLSGVQNRASGITSAVAGYTNIASGESSSVLGGGLNSATGSFSFVAGGHRNRASGRHSFAAGYGAHTETSETISTVHDGTFVWSDNDGVGGYPTFFHSSAPNQFAVRSRGGVVFRVAATDNADTGAGCSLPAGGASAWSCSSDRNLKESIQAISPQNILSKVLALPVTSWQFIGTHRRHIGPMAQDFRAAFGLGVDDKNITTSDVSGVALAAIQGLNQKLEAEKTKNRAKDAEIQALKADLALIKKKLGL